MRELLPGLWYHVRTDMPEGAQATSTASLEDLAEELPHGSGLDADWYVHARSRGKGLTLTTEWHAMNDNGYYCGWYPVRVTLDRVRGELRVANVRVRESAPGMYGVGDMLADMLRDVCQKVNPSGGAAQ